MDIKKIKDLYEVNLNCNFCNKNFKAAIYSKAFSPEVEFICDKCGVQVKMSPYKKAWRILDDDLTEEEFNSFFQKCKCGGNYILTNNHYDLYRCPYCSKLLSEEYILCALGLDIETVNEERFYCSNLVIEGNKVEYEFPGLETVGHLEIDIFNYDALFNYIPKNKPNPKEPKLKFNRRNRKKL